MTRGRKRKFNPTIPAHIDQAAIPRGIYWDKSGTGRWYRIDRGEDGKPKAVTVAGAKAYLSDLHRIAEEATTGVPAGTIQAVLDAFHTSTDFRALAPRTRADYARYKAIACALPTKMGQPFGSMPVDRLSPPVFQRLVESIAQEGHPTKANHLLRYLRRCLRWGVNHGKCKTNPVAGVQQVKEAKEVHVPSLPLYTRMLNFAVERGARASRTDGSCPPYLAYVMELAYLCRLRGIEVLTLTDAHITEQGIATNRRKGSRDTLVQWSPRLRAVVAAAQKHRKQARDAHRRPALIKPEQRFLIVAEDGEPLTRSGFDSAWQRMMRRAVKDQVIAKDERFGLHGMKHRGITDTKGTLKDKQLAGGHKSEAMTHRYDHSLPTVTTPEAADFSGDFSGGATESASGDT